MLEEKKMYCQSLLERLKMYCYDEDITYKTVAEKCFIPYTTFYSFTAGVRGMKQKYLDTLEVFLDEQGY